MCVAVEEHSLWGDDWSDWLLATGEGWLVLETGWMLR